MESIARVFAGCPGNFLALFFQGAAMNSTNRPQKLDFIGSPLLCIAWYKFMQFPLICCEAHCMCMLIDTDQFNSHNESNVND